MGDWVVTISKQLDDGSGVFAVNLGMDALFNIVSGIHSSIQVKEIITAIQRESSKSVESMNDSLGEYDLLYSLFDFLLIMFSKSRIGSYEAATSTPKTIPKYLPAIKITFLKY